MPFPLLGYPSITHGDGSVTVFHPDAGHGAMSEDEWSRVLQLEPEQVLTPDTYESPTQEDLAQPTYSASQFDHFIQQMANRENMDALTTHAAMGGDDLLDVVKEHGLPTVPANSPFAGELRNIRETFNKPGGFGTLLSGEKLQYKDVFRSSV
jgi:hypothetical protein